MTRLGRASVLLVLVCGLTACPSAPPPTPIDRPEWTVGDRWVFRRAPTGSLSGPASFVTHEVTEAGPDGYAVRVTRLNQEYTRRLTRELHVIRHEAGGRPINTFDPPAAYFAWPLLPGKTWQQVFEYRDSQGSGRYTNTWRVGEEIERVDVIAGQFLAVRIMRFGATGEGLERTWFAPAVAYVVRLEDLRAQFVEELVEFQRGQP